jgi:hypothetical protein
MNKPMRVKLWDIRLAIERCEMYTKFKLVNLKGRGHLGDLCIDGRIILKRSINK